MHLPRALAPLAALALCACSSLAAHVRPGPSLPVDAVAVFPCIFRGNEPAYRSFELSEALALQAMETGRYSVFGPGEFTLVRGSAENPFVGTDIAIQLANHGFSPSAALIFKPMIERRSQSATKQLYDEKGKPQGAQQVEETTIVARIEVLHSASREVVGDISASVDIDPFAPRDATDPLPEATLLLKKMMEALLSALPERAPGKPVERAPGFEYVWNPKAALEFSLENKPAFKETLAQLDALEQDVALEARLRFFLPLAEPALVSRLSRLPGGLYVTAVGPAAATSGLVTGDLIVSIDGEPGLPQVLHRRLRSALPGQPMALKVRRSSGMVDLSLPAP